MHPRLEAPLPVHHGSFITVHSSQFNHHGSITKVTIRSRSSVSRGHGLDETVSDVPATSSASVPGAPGTGVGHARSSLGPAGPGTVRSRVALLVGLAWCTIQGFSPAVMPRASARGTRATAGPTIPPPMIPRPMMMCIRTFIPVTRIEHEFCSGHKGRRVLSVT